MRKFQKPLTRKVAFVFAACLTTILFAWATAEDASAHGERVNLPFDLAACTARVMVCQPTSTTSTPLRAASTDVNDLADFALSMPLDKRECVDGAGVPQSCTEIGPFQYMPQIFSIEKGAVEERLQNLPAMGATPCVDNMAGLFPCSNVDLLSFLPLEDIGGASANDIWGWTDPITDGEYVLMGLSTGTAFVNISDPAAPVYLGILPAEDGLASSWRDIKVYKNHAFIVADDLLGLPRSHGLQVFDLTVLPTIAPASQPITFTTTTAYHEFNTSHNIAINEETGYAYVVGIKGLGADDPAMTCSGGLHMVDVSEPANPTFAGCFGEDGYTHDAQCVIYNGPDSTYQGREICFNSNENSVTIVDVTDKSAPVELSTANYYCTSDEETTCATNVRRGWSYIHQGWLTDDHAIFVQNDEKDEQGDNLRTATHLWNVEDLDNLTYMGSHKLTTKSYDHNLYIHDQYIYEANYSSGLRVLDATYITNSALFEQAYFDTYPENDNNSYVGAWSSYPFFDSDVVVVSSIDEGLFILQPNLSRATVQQTYMPFLPK